MKDLEELLTKVSKPEVKVPSFQQNLRRSLLKSHRHRENVSGRFRIGFYLSTGVATAFAAILIMFVIQPALPFKIHGALISDSEVIPAKKDREARLARVDVSDLEDILAKLFLQRPPSAGTDLDRAFVRYSAEQRYKSDPGPIQPLGKTQLVAVNKYRLGNGERVKVYTQVPLGEFDASEPY